METAGSAVAAVAVWLLDNGPSQHKLDWTAVKAPDLQAEVRALPRCFLIIGE